MPEIFYLIVYFKFTICILSIHMFFFGATTVLIFLKTNICSLSFKPLSIIVVVLTSLCGEFFFHRDYYFLFLFVFINLFCSKPMQHAVPTRISFMFNHAYQILCYIYVYGRERSKFSELVFNPIVNNYDKICSNQCI